MSSDNVRMRLPEPLPGSARRRGRRDNTNQCRPPEPTPRPAPDRCPTPTASPTALPPWSAVWPPEPGPNGRRRTGRAPSPRPGFPPGPAGSGRAGPARGDVGIARDPPPPGAVGRLADADPGRDPGAGGGGTPSVRRVRPWSPVTRSAPFWAEVIPKAWQSLAGPLVRLRSVVPGGRARRMTGRPATGARARRRTAWAVPSGPQTTLAHQCIP